MNVPQLVSLFKHLYVSDTYKRRGMDIIAKSRHTINLIAVLVITNPK